MEIKNTKFMKGIRGTDEILLDDVPQTAFVGRSNVGKSSVINALTNNKSLAKVGKKPGKTTEINFFLINSTFYIVDLPGYGYAQASLKEKQKLKNLIVWYLTYSEAKPKAVVLVLDVKAGLTEFDKEMLMVLTEEEHPCVIAVNKIDKMKQGEVTEVVYSIKKEYPKAHVMTCSTKTGKGIAALRARLFA